MNTEIRALIEKYAEVYKTFEKHQKGCDSILTGGDQKTGVIAEYYAKCYIDATFNKAKEKAKYACAGSPFDICYTGESDQEIRIQVKGVSAHSKTRTIAPLRLISNEGVSSFDYLYLVDLDENFLPAGLYINSWEQITSKTEEGRIKIQGSKMRDTDKKKGGSRVYDFSENKVEELRTALKLRMHK